MFLRHSVCERHTSVRQTGSPELNQTDETQQTHLTERRASVAGAGRILKSHAIHSVNDEEHTHTHTAQMLTLHLLTLVNRIIVNIN